MKEKLCSLLRKKDSIIILSLALAIAALTVIASFMPDTRPGKLRNELARQGYSVEHIEFEFVKNIRNEVWVFQSSEPILHDGHYIEYWELTRRTVGFSWPHIRTAYYVKPYLLEG